MKRVLYGHDLFLRSSKVEAKEASEGGEKETSIKSLLLQKFTSKQEGQHTLDEMMTACQLHLQRRTMFTRSSIKL